NLLEKARLKGNEDSWGNFNFGLILKTKSPEDADKARKAVENIYFEYRTKPYAKEEGLSLEEYIEKNGTIKIQLTSLANSRLYSPVEDTPEGNANYQLMLIMLGLSILILVLSVVNYVNLATANAIKRAKEVGVRKILGATKNNIIRQFIFETVLITIMAIVLALVIVELSLPYYNQFLHKSLVISSGQFYFQLIVIFFVVVIMAGMF